MNRILRQRLWNFYISIIQIKNNKEIVLIIRPISLIHIFFISRMNSSQEMEKKIPPVNWDADTWPELIDLTDAGTMEPPTTQHFSDVEIQNFINNSTKPDIPDLPCHSQSVERSVKLVTEASHSVYGFEARHRSILTKLLIRKIRPMFMSKEHYSLSYDHLYS